MISFFTGIWPKIAAIFAAVAGVLVLVIKFLLSKNAKLKLKANTLVKEKKIAKKQNDFKADVKVKETEEIKSAITKSSGKSKLDKLNSL